MRPRALCGTDRRSRYRGGEKKKKKVLTLLLYPFSCTVPSVGFAAPWLVAEPWEEHGLSSGWGPLGPGGKPAAGPAASACAALTRLRSYRMLPT